MHMILICTASNKRGVPEQKCHEMYIYESFTCVFTKIQKSEMKCSTRWLLPLVTLVLTPTLSWRRLCTLASSTHTATRLRSDLDPTGQVGFDNQINLIHCLN